MQRCQSKHTLILCLPNFSLQMNRSLSNVLFGGIAPAKASGKKVEGTVTQVSVDDVVEELVSASSVIICPVRTEFPKPAAL